jgi:hypothetical protein
MEQKTVKQLLLEIIQAYLEVEVGNVKALMHQIARNSLTLA